MAIIRFQALQSVLGRSIPEVKAPYTKISDYFGQNVFDKSKMKAYMSKEAFQAIVSAGENGTPIERDIAEHIAAAMKSWAMSKGVTHYTHWFQPLTGTTAEKHDSFFEPAPDGSPLEKFSA